MRRGPGSFTLAWCALYTLAVPAHARDRRREELASHVWEALAETGGHWRSRAVLFASTVVGAFDDVRWCDQIRAAHGLPGVLATALLGQVGSTTIAGVSVLAAYVGSLSNQGPFPWLMTVGGIVAAAVTVSSLTARAWRWWFRRTNT